MRWEFSSSTVNGLRVIPEIPSLSPCLIEGRNGIGKTVAVQLIQLASGELPAEFHERPDLWSSMRERIGATEMIVSDLRGAREIRVRFTPLTWPTTPDTSDLDLIGAASVDGESVPMTTVGKLLSVERIAGNEDLSNSIDRHRALLESQLKAAGDRVRAREKAVRAVAGELLSDLERVDPAVLAKSAKTLLIAEDAVATAALRSQEIAERLALVVRLGELTRKRAFVDEAALNLLASRDEAVSAVQALERDLQAAQTKADGLAKILRLEGGVSEKFAELSELLRKREAREARDMRNTAESAKKLDVQPIPEEVAREIYTCDYALDSLESEERQLDSAGDLRELLDALGSNLESSHLDDQLLAENYTPALSVANARRSISERRNALSAAKTPAEVRTLRASIQLLQNRRDDLAALNDALSQLARTTDLRAQAQAEYEELEHQVEAASQNSVASRAADAAVGSIQHELTLAHERMASATHQLASQGTISQADADREIAILREQLGVKSDDVEPDPNDHRKLLATADAEVEAARHRVAVASRGNALLQAEAQHLATRLMNEPWLRSMTTVAPLFLESGEPDIDRYAQVRDAVLGGLQSIKDAGQLLARLEGLCRGFFDSRPSGPSSLDEASRTLWAPFQKMLASRLLDGLRSSSIRNRLFDDGEVTELDPSTRTLTITHQNGRVESRPMSSYSTGEQAFAFTQARILDIQVSPEPNRLLVLDEFGAFVSADRMPDLAEFLASEPVARIADQVVVILPLQVNYEVEVENTTGALRDRYESRLTQIRERGYCAVELT